MPARRTTNLSRHRSLPQMNQFLLISGILEIHDLLALMWKQKLLFFLKRYICVWIKRATAMQCFLLNLQKLN